MLLQSDYAIITESILVRYTIHQINKLEQESYLGRLYDS